MAIFEINPIKRTLKAVILSFIILFFIIIPAIQIVSPGTVQVVTRLGKVTGRILEPGPHLIIPLIEHTLTYNTKKIIYETTSADKQTVSNADYRDFPVDTNTKDGQQVDIYYTIRFSLDPTKVTWIAQNLGSERAVVEKVLKAESRIWVRNIPREFEAEKLYTGNIQEVQLEIEKTLQPIFEKNGIILDTVGIREIKFSPDFVKAIESKQIEAVKVATERNKAEQAKFQKEQRITQAEGQAREQELQRVTLSDAILQKLWIEKWDGKLPATYVADGSSGAVPFLNLNK